MLATSNRGTRPDRRRPVCGQHMVLPSILLRAALADGFQSHASFYQYPFPACVSPFPCTPPYLAPLESTAKANYQYRTGVLIDSCTGTWVKVFRGVGWRRTLVYWMAGRKRMPMAALLSCMHAGSRW